MEKEKERFDIHHLKAKEYSSCTKFFLPSLLIDSKITSFQTLFKLGFINCYLNDNTKGYKNYEKDGVLLLFNPSVSFKENSWDLLDDVITKKSNYICSLSYNYCIEAYWMRISDKFLPNMRYYYKKGFYSQMSKNLIPYLNDTERRIIQKEPNFQKGKELEMGLAEGEMDNLELASIPSKSDWLLDLSKYIKNEETK